MRLETKGAADQRWFALYTKPHKEYVVRDLLQREGVEVYLPEVQVAVRRRGRRGSKPFFPHYLFAQFDPRDGVIARVRWTPGLRRIISAGERPVAVPPEIVNYIRSRDRAAEPQWGSGGWRAWAWPNRKTASSAVRSCVSPAAPSGIWTQSLSSASPPREGCASF